MRKTLKTALVWLVMLAVPAQGFAAATMLFCGPMHERMSGTMAAEGSAHHHAAGTESGHEHHAASSSEAAQEAPATNAADLAATDAISIAVPTPLGKTRDPDMSYVQAAADTVASVAHPMAAYRAGAATALAPAQAAAPTGSLAASVRFG